MSLEKCVAAVSGGLDSLALVTFLEKEGFDVLPRFFKYGNIGSVREFEAAKKLYPNIKVIQMSLPYSPGAGNSMLLNSGVSPVVPGRNMLFIANLLGIAMTENCSNIAIGYHQDDCKGFPDCTPLFTHYMAGAVAASSEGSVEFIAPFLHKEKSELIELLVDAGKMDEMFMTHSCYYQGMSHCADCPTCLERIKAFKDAGVTDKTIYRRKVC